MNVSFGSVFSALAIALALAGSAYALAAAALVRRFARAECVAPLADYPAVTQLKPLAAPEPALVEHLRSFCRQRYPAPVEILLGVQTSARATKRVLRELQAECGRETITLVVSDDPAPGANPKIANLIAMAPRIAHPTIVLADSDIVVGPDYLATIVAELAVEEVGLVTCLYRGLPTPNVWSRLARMAIDHHFVPGVLVGRALGLAEPCFGSTLAFSRDTLERIGGFSRFAHHLADDYAIGEAVRAAGRRVIVSRYVVGHACPESSLRELVRHELRWARTIRAVDWRGYAGSVVTHATPFALAAAIASGASPIALATLFCALACRLHLQRSVDRALGAERDSAWLGVARDFLSFAVFVACFFVRVVTWRGRRYRVRRDGTLEAIDAGRA